MKSIEVLHRSIKAGRYPLFVLFVCLLAFLYLDQMNRVLELKVVSSRLFSHKSSLEQMRKDLDLDLQKRLSPQSIHLLFEDPSLADLVYANDVEEIEIP